MKVTLDLDKLLHNGNITQAEYEKLSELAAKSTGSLAFAMLVGFSVIAVSVAALAIVPAPITAVIIGLGVFVLGLALLRSVSKYLAPEMAELLANICILVGALMAGGGVIAMADGSLVSILAVAAFFAMASIAICSGLLAVLATLMLSASIGASTEYLHASYFLVIQEPTITVVLFSLLAIGLYQLSKVLHTQYEGISLASARTSVFLVNFGFWVGSLWGDRFGTPPLIVPDWAFCGLWALALLATALWAWRQNRRWVLNTVATFASIHLYTQWFERLGASPGNVLAAGLVALAIALWIQSINAQMQAHSLRS